MRRGRKVQEQDPVEVTLTAKVRYNVLQLCCRCAPNQEQLQRFVAGVAETVVNPGRSHDGVSRPDRQFLSIHPHDALTLDEVVKLLQRVVAVVAMGSLTRARRQFPNLDADGQPRGVSEESPSRDHTVPFVDGGRVHHVRRFALLPCHPAPPSLMVWGTV